MTLTGSSMPLLDDLHAVTIETGQTVFEGKKTNSGYLPLYRDQAVLSMPRDPAVQALLAPAAERRRLGYFRRGRVRHAPRRRQESDPENPRDASARSLTYHRTGTQADTVVDALQAVYEELQAWGITYDSVAFSFFNPSSSESVRWPSAVLADRAANCIDGGMLFASVMESLQLEPVVVFVPGHAYMGVRQAPGSTLLWPVETTMLGNAPFLSALLQGIGEYQNPGIQHLAEMDIKAARLAGLVPIPE